MEAFNSWVEAYHNLTFDKVTGFYGPPIISYGQNAGAGINTIFGPDTNMLLHQDPE